MVFFWAPVTGATTGGSVYPRTELRETFKNGKKRNWRYREGSHSLRASLEVTQLPSTRKVVIGQMHAKDTPRPYIKLVYREERGVGYVNVELRHRPSDVKSPVVMTYKSMPLDTRFNYSIDVSRTGKLKVAINSLEYHGQIDKAWASKYFYFKAGMYTLDNQGPRSEGGRAKFYSLSAVHKP